MPTSPHSHALLNCLSLYLIFFSTISEVFITFGRTGLYLPTLFVRPRMNPAVKYLIEHMEDPESSKTSAIPVLISSFVLLISISSLVVIQVYIFLLYHTIVLFK